MCADDIKLVALIEQAEQGGDRKSKENQGDVITLKTVVIGRARIIRVTM